jgi:ureidoacrylate peracid hydrolase
MSTSTRALQARPLPIELDVSTTAVVVVDMQNGFVSPGGSWAISGVDTTPMAALVPAIACVLDAARRVGVPVVYLTMPLPPQPDPDVIPAWAFGGTGQARWKHYVAMNQTGRPAPPEPVLGDSPTWNADIVDGLAPRDDETIVVKWTFGGFHGTDLDALLRDRGISTLLFTGCTTSVCVETTLREGMSRGYNCVLIEDCVAEPLGANQVGTNHDATVRVAELVLGWVANSTDVVATLGT